MSDNTTITPGTGVTVAADDVGGVLHQRVKVSLGGDGAAADALGGAGPVAAGVQRVTLASDDPAVTAIGSTNTKLDTLHADLATTLAGYVDGLETLNGPVTETAPASDTASSGLNGRLQRIAQRLTSLIALLPASLGAKAGASSLSVVPASDAAFALAAGTALVGKVKTKFIEAVAATMTRPNDTTAYAANDAVANNTSAGSVTPFSFSMSDVNDDPVTIERLRLITTDTGFAGKAMRMWLFRASPTPGAGDNGAFTCPRSTFIGSLSGTMRTFSDGSGGVFVPDEGSRIITLPTSGAKTVFGLLQTLEAIASPLAQSTWIATLEGFQGGA